MNDYKFRNSKIRYSIIFEIGNIEYSHVMWTKLKYGNRVGFSEFNMTRGRWANEITTVYYFSFKNNIQTFRL